MHTLLLTGATGNLGSRVLAEFLRRSLTVRCILLVRGGTQAEVEQRVRTVLSFWECGPEVMERIEILCADLTEPELGLSSATRTRLAATVTHVIHCAAPVRFDQSLEEARSRILGATQNLVRLVASPSVSGTLRRFVYISSVDVAGDLTGVLEEEFLTDQSRRFLNTYQQAKAETELYLKECSEHRELPITILRPSMLVGDSHSGKIIHPQSFYHLLENCLLHPVSRVLPGKQFRVDTMPLDILSHALYLMYDAPETRGRVYNGASGATRSMLLPKLIQNVQTQYASETGTVLPVPRFIPPLLPYVVVSVQCALSWGPKRKKLQAQRDMIRYFFQDTTFDSTQFLTFLSARGVEVPPLTSYLPTVCRSFIQHRPPLALIHE